MKLEAVDQTDSSTMTVATVTQVVGRTMWVLLDGYKHDSVEHIYDVESFDLYPVGWCSMNGHPLLTPRVQRKQAFHFVTSLFAALRHIEFISQQCLFASVWQMCQNFGFSDVVIGI